MKSLLKKCIQIIKLKGKSSTWTPTPENYISVEFRHHKKEKEEIMCRFLSQLHKVSLDISEKDWIKGVEIDPLFIEKFRNVGITAELVSDQEITSIQERWNELVKIRDIVGRMN